MRLSDDLHLDSLGRVQLAAAIEEKLGLPPESGLVEQAQTVGQLRRLIASGKEEPALSVSVNELPHETAPAFSPQGSRVPAAPASRPEITETSGTLKAAVVPKPSVFEGRSRARRYIYPHWPWSPPVRWMRAAFIEAVMRPLVRFLARPRVVLPADLGAQVQEPILIIANHVTTYDGPLLQYALPGRMRRRIAAAMSGEMLDDFRHFRNPETGRFSLFGPAAWFLLTALFNVFPLPRLRDFQRSFMHAGEALDRGYHVLIFPEGTRSAAGELARFRPGIGLLVKQSNTAVLPMAIRGLGALKARGHGWFRSGAIEVSVGELIRFAPETTDAAITDRLHEEVERLLQGARAGSGPHR